MAEQTTTVDRAHARLYAELAALEAAGVATADLRDAIQRWVCALWLAGPEHRAAALAACRCPDHGCDLEEATEPDGDETGVWVTTRFRCPVGGETFPSKPDRVGGYWPVESDL